MVKNQGFIKLLILVVIAILILSYFNFDLRTIVESPQSQKNFGYATNAVTYVWQNYLSGPASYLWNQVFIGLLWNAFVHNLKKVDSGAPTTLQEMGQRGLDAINQASMPAN